MSLPTWLPWAARQDWGRRGPSFRADPVKLVLHSTEGAYWPTYSGGAVQPHLTIQWRGKSRRGFDVRQHQPLNVGARALSDSPAYPVNCMAAIQVETIGSCDKGYAQKYGLLWLPGAGDEFLADYGAFIVKLAKACGFTFDLPRIWSDTNAAYPTARQRMSLPEFERFHGVCAHQHVPANSHWDIGVTDVRRALELAGESVGTIGEDDGVLAVGDTGPDVEKLQTHLNDVYGAHLLCDGVFGAKTAAAVRHAQGALRVAVDGAWGPVTAAADKDYQSGGDLPVDRDPGKSSRDKDRKPVKPANDGPLKVDGWAGRKTISRAQHVLSTTVDGKVSGQAPAQRSRLTRWTTVTFNGKAPGSQLVAAWQEKVGSEPDGLLGPNTARQSRRWLNDHGADLTVTGGLGRDFIRAWQRWLNDQP